MHEALGHRGYVLLTLGFFVCGFQVVFVEPADRRARNQAAGGCEVGRV